MGEFFSEREGLGSRGVFGRKYRGPSGCCVTTLFPGALTLRANDAKVSVPSDESRRDVVSISVDFGRPERALAVVASGVTIPDEPSRTIAHGPDASTIATPAVRRETRASRSGSRAAAARARRSARDLLGADADLDGLAKLLERRDLGEIAAMSPLFLAREAALPIESARRLAAAFALGRCVETANARARPCLDGPERVHALLAPRVRGRAQEHFFALLLDGRQNLKRVHLVSLGTLSASLVHPREVFGHAVREAAAAVIVAHNHPSGDPAPSAEDVEVTRRLLEAASVLGIALLDHVIVATNGWTSLRAARADLDFTRAASWSARATSSTARESSVAARIP